MKVIDRMLLPACQKRNFSLIGLLAVITIIAILAGMDISSQILNDSAWEKMLPERYRNGILKCPASQRYVDAFYHIRYGMVRT